VCVSMCVDCKVCSRVRASLKIKTTMRIVKNKKYALIPLFERACE
jgi:hypothetical protein